MKHFAVIFVQLSEDASCAERQDFPMNRPFWSQPQQPQSDACETLDPLLSLYADGLASPDESRRLEAHLPGCASCRQSLLWMQATRAALASRPVMLPPAGLQAQIAASIAASSAAPVSARPARIFTLRPAFAAAASLTFVGAIVGYSLLHSHPASVAPSPPKSPMVALTTPVKPILPQPIGIRSQPLPVKIVHPAEPMIAAKTPDDEAETPLPVTQPAAKPETHPKENAVPLVKPHPHLVIRKKPILAAPVMAKLPTPKMEENHVPVIPSPDNVPDKVAAANVPPALSPGNDGSVTVTPHEAAPVMTASSNTENHVRTADFMASVREHVGLMHAASFTPVKLVRTSVVANEPFVQGAITYASTPR